MTKPIQKFESRDRVFLVRRGLKMRNAQKIERLTNHAQAGDLAAQEYLIEDFFFREKPDVGRASYWAHRAAKNGSAAAMAFLGNAFDNGIGVPKDRSRAVYWYRAAARKSDIRALSWLGYAYEKGLGLKRNVEKAVNYYRRAARAGSSSAQYNLAQCYFEGFGLKKSSRWAVFWWRQAAQSGHVEAQCNLGFAYAQGLHRNLRVSRMWLRRAAEQGDEIAINKLKEDQN